MRVFIATLGTETNTFSPLPTGMAAFDAFENWHGDGSRRPPLWGNLPLIEWRRLAEADGHEVVESVCAFAMPGGPVTRVAYESLRERLLDDLAVAHADVVLLNLHGAMIADGYDDCEGDLLARVRRLVGPRVPVLAEVDLHALLSAAMVEAATAIVAYKEYPHTDIAARAIDLYGLATRVARGEVRPVAAVVPVPMLMKLRPTSAPMRGIVDSLYALEAAGPLLSASIIHGFLYADAPDLGTQVLVYADADAALARRTAGEIAVRLWSHRHELRAPLLSIDAALDAALSQTGPVVLSDGADNSGAGAPSDSTFILRRALERGLTDVAVGGVWDPIAVQFCANAGVGATIDLRVGGKCGPVSGDPLDARATVMGFLPDHAQSGLGSGLQPCGPSAWIRIDGIDVVLMTLRQQVLSPDLFTGLGCRLDDKRIIVVKSSQHFQAGFAAIAKAVLYVSAPGCAPPDVTCLEYRKPRRALWPLVDERDVEWPEVRA